MVEPRPLARDQAEIVGEGEVDRPAALVPAITARVAAWSTGPEAGAPLITEDDLAVAEVSRSHTREAPWWVYVAIGGAAVVGGGTIWAFDAGVNRQRIELTFP